MLGSSIKKLLATGVLLLFAAQANAAFNINLAFNSVADSYKTYFTVAENYWESVITGYQGTAPAGGLTINVSTPAIDGSGSILGSAGPTNITNSGSFLIATNGSMQFDSADVDNMIGNGSFTDVIRHEMAHVIGFGTLWDNNNVYSNNSGRYTGSNALAAYKTEFNQPNATFVPVELGGGSGTANGHWNEVDGGSGNTGILANGQDMRFELMTGWLNIPGTFVSRTTIASFVDIGYTVSVVPEPASALMIAVGFPILLRLSARKKSKVA
jgi:hypothetical protein